MSKLAAGQVEEAEDKTAGGVLLTDSAKEKPVIGMVRLGLVCLLDFVEKSVFCRAF